MKKLFLSGAVLFSALLGAATLDGLAAKVNDAVITVGDVMNEMRRMREPSQDFRTAYSNAVEEVIDRRLILMAAAEKKLDMQEWLVDNRVREIVKDNFGGDMNKLNAQLAAAKTPLADWRNQIRDDMIVNAMRFQMVEKSVAPSPSEMRAEYEANVAKYSTEATATVRVILLRPPQDGKGPAVKARAEEILAALAKGEKFGDLAKRHSSDSHAAEGGLWKNVKPEEAFRPEIAAAISKLKDGEVSPLVDLDGWGFIVKKEGGTEARRKSFAEAYDEVAQNVRNAAVKAEHAAWTARLRAEAFIKVYPVPDEPR